MNLQPINKHQRVNVDTSDVRWHGCLYELDYERNEWTPVRRASAKQYAQARARITSYDLTDNVR